MARKIKKHSPPKNVANSVKNGPQRYLTATVVMLLLVAGGVFWTLRNSARQENQTTDISVPGHDGKSSLSGRLPLARQTAGSGSSQAANSPAGIQDKATCQDNREAQWSSWDDPLTEGWNTEVFHLKAKKQLKQLGKLMTSAHDKVEAEALAGLVTDTFVGESLVPDHLVVTYEGPQLSVEQEGPADAQSGSVNRSHSLPGGPAGLAAALGPLLAPLKDSIHVHFKIFRVLPDVDSMTTHQFVEISGNTQAGSCEQHATWIIQWDHAHPDHPQIDSVTVTNFQRTTLQQDGNHLFSDCTDSVLKANESYHKQLLRGYDDCLHRMQEERYSFILSTPGIAVGDVNGDGLEDLYLCQEDGLANRLYLQNQDGSLRDVSASWNVDWLEWSRSALLVDLDNDGDRDLAVAILGGILLMENKDQQEFQFRTVIPTNDDTMSLAAADYDQDGRLDLYACVYLGNMKPADLFGAPLGLGSEGSLFQDANNGGTNVLLHNEITDTNWAFTNVSKETGLDVHNRRYSYAAAWEDYDNDGDQDLYVANDFGYNCLYRHDTDTAGNHNFVEIGNETNTRDTANGMSVTWADYDHNGWMDVYVSNMYSSAGNRIAFRPEFGQEFPDSLRQQLQRFARGNTLMSNSGSSGEGNACLFEDVSKQTGTTMGRWAWSSNFADINNDGWDDLLVANGFVTNEDPGDL